MDDRIYRKASNRAVFRAEKDGVGISFDVGEETIRLLLEIDNAESFCNALRESLDELTKRERQNNEMSEGKTFEELTPEQFMGQVTTYAILKLSAGGSPENPVSFTPEDVQEEVGRIIRDGLLMFFRARGVHNPIL